MEPERSADPLQPDAGPWPVLGWQVTFFVGALSVILGLIVAFHPTGSLNVIAVLLGILMIFSGIFNIVGAFGEYSVMKVGSPSAASELARLRSDPLNVSGPGLSSVLPYR